MIKQFMKDLTASFLVSDVNAKFGVITYGKLAYFRVKPNQIHSNDDFIKAIEK